MRCAFLTTLSIAIALPVAADDLIERARAVSSEGPLYNYEMMYSDSEIEEARGTIFPTAPEGQRIQISYPATSEWSDEFADRVTAMDAETDGDIWCARLMSNVPENAERTSETEGAVIYTFTPEPGEEADSNERKLFRKLIGTVAIDPISAGVQSFQMHLPEPMKPNMLAKIETFSMFVQCDTAPDGRSYSSRMDMEIVGNAMGRSFGERFSREVTQLLEPVARPLP